MYHQLIVAAMGSISAGPYACLTVGFLEETILFPKLLPSIFESDIVQKIKDLYYRYINDGITVLPMNVPPLLFLSTLNNMHCSIQFTITNPTLTLTLTLTPL